MNYKKILSLIAIFVFLSPLAADASSAVRTGDAISIANDQKIEGDFYAAASEISVSGEVAEDFLSVAARNTLNGKVGKDALMVGVYVDVHGPVGEDLRIIGDSVVIAEPISGDVFVIAKSVKVLSSASIGGDLVVYGGDVEVEGSVGGTILGHYKNLRIDAPVAGDIDVTTRELTLGEKADISGTLTYVSTAQLTRAQNTKVDGDILRSDPVELEAKTSPAKYLVIGLLVFIFSILAWYLVARSLLEHVVTRALVRGMRPVLLGFVTFLAAPVVLGVLLVSVIGTIVGLVGFFAFMALCLMAVIGTAAVLGTLAVRVVKKNYELVPTPFTLVPGAVIVVALIFIPILGPLLLIIAFLVTLGALVDVILHPFHS